jgi:AAA domain, putative AbiEii toxin, Type IV TA system
LLRRVNPRATPSLRIARLVVENFRTFRERTEISLSSASGADAMPVFHGLNGSGKSNALAAINLFFRAASYRLTYRGEMRRQWSYFDEGTGLFLTHRNWPPGARDPQIIEMHFADPRIGALRVVLTPSGNEVLLRLERSRTGADEPVEFSLVDENDNETSLEPDETERWRSFVSLVGRFQTLSGRDVSVVPASDGADLRFEIRGKQILQLSELSSGEQQVIALVAAMLTSRAALVAVEEPEISLHPDNQKLVRDVLREQVESGIVDQILLESHVPVFDGPEVIRFSRSSEGVTSVARQPSSSAQENQIRALAQKSGAEEQWVTPEGYTQLQEAMRRDLGLEQGGYLWFLRGSSDGRWQAWKAGELDQ